jgi:hypothetical protein
MGQTLRHYNGWIYVTTVYVSYCSSCIFKSHPLMLTTYCLRGLRCDGCGRVSDLAMVKLNKEIEVRR